MVSDLVYNILPNLVYSRDRGREIFMLPLKFLLAHLIHIDPMGRFTFNDLQDFANSLVVP